MSSKEKNKSENKEEKQEKREKLDTDAKMRIGVIMIGVLLVLLLVGQYEPKADEYNKVIELAIEKKIEAVVGANVANRIEVKDEDLLEVTGDESKYQLKWNKNHRSIYLLPKAEVGEVIELSLMLASGEVQDLRLTIGDVLARTIVLKRKDGAVKKFYGVKEQQEMASLLRVMINDRNSENKYWVKAEKIKLMASKTQQMTQIKEYKYGKLKGQVIEIENKGKEPLIVREEEIKTIIPDAELMRFSKRIIAPKEKARLFVVSKEEENV